MQSVGSWLKITTQRFNDASISSAQLDALILAEDELEIDRAHLLAHSEAILSQKQLNNLEKKVIRRIAHEPLAYIRGKTEFYGRDFAVTPATLEPRPETETLIELFLSSDTGTGAIIDVGTGSGCIAITAKCEHPNREVYATEINEDALQIATKNADILQADVTFCQGNLLQPLSSIFNPQSSIWLLCNLPYVPDSWTINEAAMHEPRVAIFGGEDGLDLYRQLFDQINQYNIVPDLIFTESLPPHHAELCKIAESSGFIKHTSQDFIVVFRKK